MLVPDLELELLVLQQGLEPSEAHLEASLEPDVAVVAAGQVEQGLRDRVVLLEGSVQVPASEHSERLEEDQELRTVEASSSSY